MLQNNTIIMSIKKTQLKTLIILVSLFVIAASAYALPGSNDLSITTSTSKSTYDYRESIQVVMEAENITGSDVSLDFSTGCQMDFTIYRYVDGIGTYTIPMYNEILFQRNCDSTPTSITIPDGRKAIWTRTIDPTDDQYPNLPPGEYILHGFITGYANDDWSYQATSYTTFSVVPGDFQPPLLDTEYWTEKLCDGTGGTYNVNCSCPGISVWSSTVGCTENKGSDELCAETGGVLTEGAGAACYCGDLKYWDEVAGCNEELPVDPVDIVPFNDIEGHWGEAYITTLQANGVVAGYEDGGFHPDDYINRAELVKMALSAAEIQQMEPVSESGFLFNDLDEWQIPWVYAAWDQSIVEGYDETTFAPAQNITRAEALKVVMLAFGVDVPDTSDQLAFEDTVDHWALSYINQAYLDYIVSGHEDGNFYPNDHIRRAEAAKIIQLLSE
jgi:hypothetical protein